MSTFFRFGSSYVINEKYIVSIQHQPGTWWQAEKYVVQLSLQGAGVITGSSWFFYGTTSSTVLEFKIGTQEFEDAKNLLETISK